jgi:hypothetical protein
MPNEVGKGNPETIRALAQAVDETFGEIVVGGQNLSRPYLFSTGKEAVGKGASDIEIRCVHQDIASTQITSFCAGSSTETQSYKPQKGF